MDELSEYVIDNRDSALEYLRRILYGECIHINPFMKSNFTRAEIADLVLEEIDLIMANLKGFTG